MASAATHAGPLVRQRPPAAVIAAVALTIAMAIAGFATIPLIPGDVRIVIGITSSVAGVVSIVLCWWVWNLHRWAAYTLFAITFLSGLSAVPGLTEAPALAGPGLAQSIVVCALLVTPQARRAYR